MKIKNLLVCLLVLPILSACSYDDILAKAVSKEESAFAKGYLEAIRGKDFNAVKKILDPKLLASELHADEAIANTADLFPPDKPLEIKLIGAQIFESPGKWQARLSYQYKFPKEWVVATISFSKHGQKRVVDGFNLTRQTKSLQETNAFNFSNKTLIHYLFFIAAVIVALFTLWALVLCIQTQFPRRKWLWILFVLSGCFSFMLDWTTGEFAYQIFSFNFLTVGATAAGPYSPWIIHFSFPIGAVIFLLKRKQNAQVEYDH
jgi:hypothetical protein